MLKQEDYLKFIELVEEAKAKYLKATGEHASIILLDPHFAKQLNTRKVCGLYVYLDVELMNYDFIVKRRFDEDVSNF